MTVDGSAVTDLDTPIDLDPGAHDVDITRADSRDRKHVVLEEGKTEVVDLGGAAIVTSSPVVVVAMHPTSSPSRAPFWIGVALTGAAVALGSVSGGVALANANTASPACIDNQCSPTVASNVDAAKTWSTVSTISFVAAGVFAITSIVVLFGTGSEHPTCARTNALEIVF